jgi:hypothetical protein
MKDTGKKAVLFSLSRQRFQVDIPIISVNINLHSKTNILFKAPLFFFKVIYCLIKYRPDVVVGIDPFGIIVASVFHRLVRFFKSCKLHYWSFEMLFKREGFKLKNIERWSCRKLDLLIIQDQTRSMMLCLENDIKENVQKILIPVSSANTYNINRIPAKYVCSLTNMKTTIGRMEQYSDSTNLLKIVVWGTIDGWSGMDWIAGLKIPADIKLVIHNRFRIDCESEIYKLFGSKPNVELHDAYFEDNKDALDFLSNFDYGLCLYIPQEDNMYLGDNLRYVGLSSGKFAMFAQAGLPVIVNNPFQCSLIKQYESGFTIDGPEELQLLLDNLHKTAETEYLKMRVGCRKMYEEILDPAPGVNAYLGKL